VAMKVRRRRRDGVAMIFGLAKCRRGYVRVIVLANVAHWRSAFTMTETS